MRIGLLQLNAILADPEANGRRVEEAYARAVAQGADLVLTPEMAIPGYLPEDRLWETGLRSRIERENQRLRQCAGDVPLVFGTCSPSPSGRLWNELWWCQGGEARCVARKRVLAMYDIFDETRYFDPAPEAPALVDFHGMKVGLSICEDLWADPDLAPGPIRYAFDPIRDLAERGATLILNASASPGHLGTWLPAGKHPSWAQPGKLAMRRRLLQGHAGRYGLPIAYVSRVGSESWLTFDGGSGVVFPDGSWQGLNDFEEAVQVIDLHRGGEPWQETASEASWLHQALKLGLRENLRKQGLEAVVVGLSGGIDSAVVVAMAAEALGPKNVLSVALPTRYTSQESLDLARLQAERLGIHHLCLDADAPFAGATASLANVFPDRTFSLTDENLQSRARGALLMALTSEPSVHRLLGTQRLAVLNTGNKSEAATGYFTLYGDGIGAFGILGDCLKQRVFALARELGEAVPLEVVTRKPTAELAPGQTDEASLLPYALLDAILAIHLETRRPLESLSDDLAELLEGAALDQARAALPRMLRLLHASEFKRRQLPFSLKVSPKAFGLGRRIPLTGTWRES
ncbi:MAG: NAD(+) synthase [Firmicutes bacterium]|nr:NAD(+) synthase [Bacillota bacterium]